MQGGRGNCHRPWGGHKRSTWSQCHLRPGRALRGQGRYLEGAREDRGREVGERADHQTDEYQPGVTGALRQRQALLGFPVVKVVAVCI